MGLIEGTKGDLLGEFGVEGAGVVLKVGPDVKDIKVGDRVAYNNAGCFSTTIAMRELFCARIPESMSFEDAATMPCVYSTALYSLFDLARLEQDQVSLRFPVIDM
jgi:NADPH:quinone reductase-like Zn-dependent oxidoreductase